MVEAIFQIVVITVNLYAVFVQNACLTIVSPSTAEYPFE